jgi:hypothetical protein
VDRCRRLGQVGDAAGYQTPPLGLLQRGGQDPVTVLDGLGCCPVFEPVGVGPVDVLGGQLGYLPGAQGGLPASDLVPVPPDRGGRPERLHEGQPCVQERSKSLIGAHVHLTGLDLGDEAGQLSLSDASPTRDCPAQLSRVAGRRVVPGECAEPPKPVRISVLVPRATSTLSLEPPTPVSLRI